MNDWFNVIKARRKHIGGGRPPPRKRKPTKGSTTPMGSYQAELDKILKMYANGKIGLEEYQDLKDALEKRFNR